MRYLALILLVFSFSASAECLDNQTYCTLEGASERTKRQNAKWTAALLYAFARQDYIDSQQPHSHRPRGVYTFGDNYVIGPNFVCTKIGRTVVCN